MNYEHSAIFYQLKFFRRKNLMSFEKELKELSDRKARALEMGGSEKVKKQHDRGKLTARERIDLSFGSGFVSRGRHVQSLGCPRNGGKDTGRQQNRRLRKGGWTTGGDRFE